MPTNYVLALQRGNNPIVSGEGVTLFVNIFPAGTDPFAEPSPVPLDTLSVYGSLADTAQTWQALVSQAFSAWCRVRALEAGARAAFGANAQMVLTVTDPTGN